MAASAVNGVAIANLIWSSRFKLFQRSSITFQEFSRLGCRNERFAFGTAIRDRHIL
jgi:hypothetical protein